MKLTTKIEFWQNEPNPRNLQAWRGSFLALVRKGSRGSQALGVLFGPSPPSRAILPSRPARVRSCLGYVVRRHFVLLYGYILLFGPQPSTKPGQAQSEEITGGNQTQRNLVLLAVFPLYFHQRLVPLVSLRLEGGLHGRTQNSVVKTGPAFIGPAAAKLSPS